MKKSWSLLLFCLIAGVILVSCNNGSSSSSSLNNNVDVSTFAELIASGKGQLIDVRTPEEFAAGHIDKAINIDFYDKKFDVNLISALDANKPVYVYCRSGGRSAKAAKRLIEKLNYKQPVFNLLGGYGAWSEVK